MRERDCKETTGRSGKEMSRCTGDEGVWGQKENRSRQNLRNQRAFPKKE